MIDSFIDDEVGIANGFLSANLIERLRGNIYRLYANQSMVSAGIGNATIVVQDQLIRKDVIYWLDRSHNDDVENQFFKLMDCFVLHLNTTCFTGITSYEFHYALYEKGSFYKKHIDQFQQNGQRAFSMILYLNENWQENDGGELRIYHLDHRQNISPSGGKSVFFKSNELAHEVLLTHVPRMSITGWFKV